MTIHTIVAGKMKTDHERDEIGDRRSIANDAITANQILDRYPRVILHLIAISGSDNRTRLRPSNPCQSLHQRPSSRAVAMLHAIT